MSDEKNSWTTTPEEEDDEEIVSAEELEEEATRAALATAELFQNLDLDEEPPEPNPRHDPALVPPEKDDLADTESIGITRRVGQGFSRGLFWAVGLAFGLMIITAIGLLWMVFNIISKLA